MLLYTPKQHVPATPTKSNLPHPYIKSKCDKYTLKLLDWKVWGCYMLTWWHCCPFGAMRREQELGSLATPASTKKACWRSYQHLKPLWIFHFFAVIWIILSSMCLGCCGRGEAGLERSPRRLHDGSFNERLGQGERWRGRRARDARWCWGQWFRLIPPAHLDDCVHVTEPTLQCLEALGDQSGEWSWTVPNHHCTRKYKMNSFSVLRSPTGVWASGDEFGNSQILINLGTMQKTLVQSDKIFQCPDTCTNFLKC